MTGQASPPTWGTCKISKKCKREAGASGYDKGASLGELENLVGFSWRGTRSCWWPFRWELYLLCLSSCNDQCYIWRLILQIMTKIKIMKYTDDSFTLVLCFCSFTFCASISSFCNSLECNSVGDFFETLVILSAILLPIKSPVASAVF